MNEKNFDERQVFNKNRIGNQCFLLLVYLLFADAGLYGFGVKWMPYPANVFIILLACLFVYLIRLIASGSYAGPRAGKKTVYATIAVIGIAVAIAAAIIVFLNGGGPGTEMEDNSGMILFIISVVMLAVALVVSLIRKRQDKGGDE